MSTRWSAAFNALRAPHGRDKTDPRRNALGQLSRKSARDRRVHNRPVMADGLKMSVGPKFDHDIIESTALAAGVVSAIETASVVSGFGSTAEFTTSKVAAVHMEDTSPQDITGGSQSPAVPVKSLWQTDAIALKTAIWAAWGLRAAGHAQWVTGATW